ncbi:unnamed protein product [Penicillium olsonii]|nr:unnamed protein product [Penicillium olsonii]
MASPRNPTLDKLPLEILWMISDHLSSVDIICLALGNRRLLNSFAGIAFKSFPKRRTGGPTDAARIQLLSRLSSDLPQYYVCFICLRLHLWRRIGLPTSSLVGADPHLWNWVGPTSQLLDPVHMFEERNLQQNLPLASYPCYSSYRFYFVHLQLAMRRFYHGRAFGIPVESMLYTEISSHRFRSKGPQFLQNIVNENLRTNTHEDRMMTVFSAEARICSQPPGLCMRVQEVAVVTRHNVPRMWPSRQNGFMSACTHLTTRVLEEYEQDLFGPAFREILESQLLRYCSTTSPKIPPDQGHCDECNTSWKLEIRTLDETHASLVLTLWMDLGPGISPADPEWKYRLFFAHRAAFTHHKIVNSRLRFEK